MTVAKLETKIQGAFIWLSLLTIACGIVVLIFFGNFSSIEKEISGVNQSVAVESSTMNSMDRTLTRIEDKLDKTNGVQPESRSAARRP